MERLEQLTTPYLESKESSNHPADCEAESQTTGVEITIVEGEFRGQEVGQ